MEVKIIMKKSTTIKAIVAGIIGICVFALYDYLFLPAQTIHSSYAFFGYILGFVVSIVIFSMTTKGERHKGDVVATKVAISGFVVIGLAILLLMLFGLSGITMFHAKEYSTILTVEEGTINDLPDVDGADAIALMDTDSAKMLGDREIGGLVDIVSQYDVSNNYTQINYNSHPYKVAPLVYASFFKADNEKGIPGYVIVDPVNMDAKYVSLDKPMKYVPSAYFSYDLFRHMRNQHPSLLFDSTFFEIDEDGNPYYVTSVVKKTIGMYGGKDVIGAIVTDPCSGESKYYELSEVPSWVDTVYNGDIIMEQYNWHGMLSGGFGNSLFGQKGCKQTTAVRVEDEDGNIKSVADFGYIAKDGDIYVYTGITSANGDSSNLGFILTNERTGETKFIQIAGADEASAMNAAMGEVQEKGYVASFPSLIRTESVPTYIMVLKDNAGLVKLYAAVNVEQYNMVATGVTQSECLEKYQRLVSGEISQEEASDDAVTTIEEPKKNVDTTDWKTKTVTITKMESIVTDGESVLYVVDENGNVYHAAYVDVIETMILLDSGSQVTILTDGEQFLIQ